MNNSATDEYILVPRPKPPAAVVDGPREGEDSDTRRRGVLHTDFPKVNTQDESKVRLLNVHRALRGVRNARPVRAYLSYQSTTTQTADTFLTFSRYVQPNLDSSFASWQNVFDEMKVISTEVFWLVERYAAATVAPSVWPLGVMVYEPTDFTPLASVTAALQYENFQLVSLNNSYVHTPLPHTRTGLNHYKTKIPSGTSLSNVDTTLSSGMWRPTVDASNYYWGLFHGALDRGGTSCVFRIHTTVRMLVDFRVRK